MKKVAAAIVGRSKVLLLDGVDLNSASSPARAVSRTNEVVHKFWQYKRLREKEVLQGNFLSVGLVIDGHTHRGDLRIQREFEEAHDYAVEQFEQETALTIDTRSDSDQEKFTELLKEQAIPF